MLLFFRLYLALNFTNNIEVSFYNKCIKVVKKMPVIKPNSDLRNYNEVLKDIAIVILYPLACLGEELFAVQDSSHLKSRK
jgi:hypothetical protein